MVKKRIACFLTGGYSEAGYMQIYLEKINNNYEYKQYLPNKTKKKKGDDKKLLDDFNGLTGDSLIDKICELLDNLKIKRDIEDACAILIEDDLDDRFKGFNDKKIEEYLLVRRKRILAKLKKEMPIIFLLASPEIESWFAADWGNGFGYIIGTKSFMVSARRETRRFYSEMLHREIDKLCNGIENIEYYAENQIQYVKLSEEIQNLISVEVVKNICKDKKTNIEIKNDLERIDKIYYSKRQHGSLMLKQIDPDKVVIKCKKYFKIGYYQLKELKSILSTIE